MQSNGTRRGDVNKRRAPVPAPRRRFGLKKITLASGAAILAVAGVYVFFSTGSAALVREWGRERLVTLAGNAGYRVGSIYVEGRHYTEADILRGIINMKKGDPLFAFDPETARDLLMRVSWVKDATVERQLPNAIYIKITEREPIALWQHDGKVRVIDGTGAILTAELAPFSKLPLVVGDGANLKAAELMSMMSAEPDLLQRMETAQWVGDRRWDLTFKNGVVTKLPEDDMGLALRKLADSQRQDNLLDKDLALIDLREADRLIVRTKPGAVQEYKASFKPGEKDL